MYRRLATFGIRKCATGSSLPHSLPKLLAQSNRSKNSKRPGHITTNDNSLSTPALLPTTSLRDLTQIPISAICDEYLAATYSPCQLRHFHTVENHTTAVGEGQMTYAEFRLRLLDLLGAKPEVAETKSQSRMKQRREERKRQISQIKSYFKKIISSTQDDDATGDMIFLQIKSIIAPESEYKRFHKGFERHLQTLAVVEAMAQGRIQLAEQIAGWRHGDNEERNVYADIALIRMLQKTDRTAAHQKIKEIIDEPNLKPQRLLTNLEMELQLENKFYNERILRTFEEKMKTIKPNTRMLNLYLSAYSHIIGRRQMLRWKTTPIKKLGVLLDSLQCKPNRHTFDILFNERFCAYPRWFHDLVKLLQNSNAGYQKYKTITAETAPYVLLLMVKTHLRLHRSPGQAFAFLKALQKQDKDTAVNIMSKPSVLLSTEMRDICFLLLSALADEKQQYLLGPASDTPLLALSIWKYAQHKFVKIDAELFQVFLEAVALREGASATSERRTYVRRLFHHYVVAPETAVIEPTLPICLSYIRAMQSCGDVEGLHEFYQRHLSTTECSVNSSNNNNESSWALTKLLIHPQVAIRVYKQLIVSFAEMKQTDTALRILDEMRNNFVDHDALDESALAALILSAKSESNFQLINARIVDEYRNNGVTPSSLSTKAFMEMCEALFRTIPHQHHHQQQQLQQQPSNGQHSSSLGAKLLLLSNTTHEQRQQVWERAARAFVDRAATPAATTTTIKNKDGRRRSVSMLHEMIISVIDSTITKTTTAAPNTTT